LGTRGGDDHEASGNVLESSFRFHRDLESLPEFCRREWRPLLFFGLSFTLLVVSIIVFVDESFFYSRVQTDALWYYLKGRAFAETGATTARLAINMQPFVFNAMPGVLRAPFIRAFGAFDDQLRGIQLANVVIMDAVALMSAYVLSWAVPRKWHWITIAFSFVFSIMAPWWMQNVFLPQTDAPYAAFSLASVLIAVAIIASPRARTEKVLSIAFAIVFVGAFLMRFTEPAVLVLVGALLWGRYGSRRIPATTITTIAVAAIISIALLVALNREAIFGKYFLELKFFARAGEKQSMLLNLFCLAIPQQIIPAFDLGFSHPPILGRYHGQFSSTRGDVAWSVAGLLISMVVVAGVWRSRRRFAPEILMLLTVMPALVVLMPSTPRYLMTYQAFFWIWFYEGSSWIAAMVPARTQRLSRNLALVAVAAALMIGLTLGLKSRGLLSRPSSPTAENNLASYVRGETGTYRPLEKFMKTLPRDRAILISITSALGRWKAISDLDYYFPDSAITKIASTKDMYVVLDCGSADMCATFSRAETEIRTTLALYGSFSYQLVFEASARKSRAEVFRIRPAIDSSAEAAGKQKGNR
jgi:hypothetical protein